MIGSGAFPSHVGWEVSPSPLCCLPPPCWEGGVPLPSWLGSVFFLLGCPPSPPHLVLCPSSPSPLGVWAVFPPLLVRGGRCPTPVSNVRVNLHKYKMILLLVWGPTFCVESRSVEQFHHHHNILVCSLVVKTRCRIESPGSWNMFFIRYSSM